jgi:hypothetical protein
MTVGLLRRVKYLSRSQVYERKANAFTSITIKTKSVPGQK